MMANPRITDITLTYREPMRGFRKLPSKQLGKDGWNASELLLYSHSGTHMDAPLHFGVNNTTIDQLPPERFICNCHLIRLPFVSAGEILEPGCLGDIKDQIRKGEGLIFHTGWSRYVSDPAMYRDQLPRIGKELAMLLAEKEINLVGVEPPSIANVNKLEELQEIHRIFMEANILILEGLTNLEEVQSNYAKLIALPLKIGGGDGAPARVLIIEDTTDII